MLSLCVRSFLLGCALFGKNQLRAACTAFEDAVAKDPKDWVRLEELQ